MVKISLGLSIFLLRWTNIFIKTCPDCFVYIKGKGTSQRRAYSCFDMISLILIVKGEAKYTTTESSNIKCILININTCNSMWNFRCNLLPHIQITIHLINFLLSFTVNRCPFYCKNLIMSGFPSASVSVCQSVPLPDITTPLSVAT